MQLKHRTLIIISGLLWFIIGLSLFTFGISLILNSVQQMIPGQGSHFPLLQFVMAFVGNQAEYAAIALISFCLVIGHFKGRYVLAKSVNRLVKHIRSQPNPVSLAKIYSPSYYALLGTMILIGISMKYFGMVSDVRGAIDTAVGAALLNGSMLYFRSASQEAHL